MDAPVLRREFKSLVTLCWSSMDERSLENCGPNMQESGSLRPQRSGRSGHVGSECSTTTESGTHELAFLGDLVKDGQPLSCLQRWSRWRGRKWEEPQITCWNWMGLRRRQTKQARIPNGRRRRFMMTCIYIYVYIYKRCLQKKKKT